MFRLLDKLALAAKSKQQAPLGLIQVGTDYFCHSTQKK